tara:strand:+ start:1994 stop:2218 length:225 start_codon:yes stop_codon:yes gene_type:complete
MSDKQIFMTDEDILEEEKNDSDYSIDELRHDSVCVLLREIVEQNDKIIDTLTSIDRNTRRRVQMGLSEMKKKKG